MGAKLKKLGYGTGLYPNSPYVAVKVPVFSFEKLNDVNSQLGPEMKSTVRDSPRRPRVDFNYIKLIVINEILYIYKTFGL